jgi:hypothetical protein
MRWKTGLKMLALVCATPGTVLACPAPFRGGPTEIADRLIHGDIIFVGRLANVANVEGADAALLTVTVDYRIKGDLGDESTILFNSGPDAVAERVRLYANKQLVFSVLESGQSEPRSNWTGVDVRTDLPMVIDTVCGPDGFQVASPDLISAIRRAL